MFQYIFSNKVLWGIILTFVIAGLGSITGLISPMAASWVTLVVSGLTGIGHTANLLKGAGKQ